jgi:hypothetical protein
MSTERERILQAISRPAALDVALYRGIMNPLEGGAYAQESFSNATLQYSLTDLLNQEKKNRLKTTLFLSINGYLKNEKKTPSAELNKLYQPTSKANVVEHELQHCLALPKEIINEETRIEITFANDHFGKLLLVGHAVFDYQNIDLHTMVQVLLAPEVLGMYDTLLAQTLLYRTNDVQFQKLMTALMNSKLKLDSYIFR